MAPNFYGYEERIITALEKEGLEVCFEYIYKPSRFERYVSKLYKRYYRGKLNKYYVEIIKKYIDVPFDYFLVVDGKGIPDFFLRVFLKRHPETTSVYYSWDSLQYFNYLSWLNFFNKVYTFDYKDAAELNIGYLPLFYTPELEIAGKAEGEKIYDLLFIASYKESRLEFINSIIEKYETSLNIKVVLYLSVFRYIIDKLKGKSIRRKDVVFRSLPFDDYLRLLSKTKVVLDFTAKNQTGMPMRIPEAIGARKKIITNNEKVQEEFNNSDNILVYRESEDITYFINSEMSELRERERYSISNWIKEMLR